MSSSLKSEPAASCIYFPHGLTEDKLKAAFATSRPSWLMASACLSSFFMCSVALDVKVEISSYYVGFPQGPRNGGNEKVKARVHLIG